MSSNPKVPEEVLEREASPRKRRTQLVTSFSSAELHARFKEHVSRAQHLFLQGDKDGAEREATLALRIRPTDQLFALLAVVAESKGQFDRASDFRLLQAFIAKDTVLWEELLDEFLREQRYYKSAVCLQRLSALETKDAARYRSLQLQLADLYIGLGEIKRATSVLIPLWNESRFRDFEVFALLSSLFFQLGRWNSLHRLIETSLKSVFRTNSTGILTGAKRAAELEQQSQLTLTLPDGTSTASTQGKKRPRTSKRVRFFGDDDDDDDDDNNDNNKCKLEEEEKEKDQRKEYEVETAIQLGCAQESAGEVDDFDFSTMAVDDDGQGISQNNTDNSVSGISKSKNMDSNSGNDDNHSPKMNRLGTVHGEAPSGIISSLYGERIEFKSTTAKRNFLTLVNVHAELLNEEGHFSDTVRLIEFTAGCLQVPILELPPDLLVRLGVSYAYIGGLEKPCREVFEHLVETCPMDEYGDVLFDAAHALQQVGMHADARAIFCTLRRYHEFRLQSASDDASDDANAAELREELKTVFTASLFAEGQCESSLGHTESARVDWERVLVVDPVHLQTRLALGRLCEYELHETERAITLLTPREDEAPVQRLQLGAELVRIFARAGKHVEAIALGVSIFELILSGEDDGDTESVAPSTSRRSGTSLMMPTLSRASSAIIPPSAMAEMVNGPRLASTAASSVGRLSHTLATSIRASSAVFRSALARRGSAPLTNSAYGASAAASTMAGRAGAGEEERLKDASAIFRFNRQTRKKSLADGGTGTQRSGLKRGAGGTPSERATKRHRRGVRRGRGSVSECGDMDEFGLFASPAPSEERGEGEEEEEEEEKKKMVGEDDEAERRKRKRAAEITNLDADSFWKVVKQEPLSSVNTEAPEMGEMGGKEDANPGLKSTTPWSTSETCDDADENALDPSQYALPSLEEISAQFTDPAMRELFVQASSHEKSLTESTSMMNATSAEGIGISTAVQPVMRVTLRDAVAVLGRTGFVELAVTVIDCYSAIGNFTEAKEFAFLILTRCSQRRTFRHVVVLERPLRWAVLRAALAAREGEDAYRVGVRLLQEDCSETDRNRVMELLFGVLNRVEDTGAILLRLVVDRNMTDAPTLVLLGNRYFGRRSYVRALNLYLTAGRLRPDDLLICFLIGLSYLLISHQKKIRANESCVTAGWHYLERYQEGIRAVDPQRSGEAVYNCARAFQFLGLHQLAVPLYEQVAYKYNVPRECTLAHQRAARLNLYFTYRWRTGNAILALDALHPRSEHF